MKMSEDLPEKMDPRVARTTRADVAAGIARAGLGMIPLVGPVVTEIVTAIIPGQRMDRLHAFLEALAVRVEGLEAGTFEQSMKTPEAIDLLEDVMAQAARAMSEERIGYLANLLATGVTDEAADNERNKKMAELLGGLTDAEVVWLGSYASFQVKDGYYEKHAAVLAPVAAHLGSTDAEYDAETLQESWIDKLRRLGLVQRKLKTEFGTNQPIPDRFGGDWEYQHPQLSWLGAMLLNSIGIATDLRGRSQDEE